MKLPAFQFYPADWRKDVNVQSLTFEQKGVWIELLCIMHQCEERGKLIANSKPIPCKILAKMVGIDTRKMQKILQVLLNHKVAYQDENGVIYNKRMVKDEQLIKVRRESGSKGGNPNLVNQNAKQKPTPSFASSSSFTKEHSRPEELNEEKIIEYLRGATSPIVSSLQIKKEAIAFIQKYQGAKIVNLRSLVNSWADKIIPEGKKQMVV